MQRFLPVLGALCGLAGCGGGGGGDDDTPTIALNPIAPVTNVLPISVEPGPANGVNLAFTSVTLCTPGNSSQCQTINHVLVDTGSFGLRIMSSVLSPNLGLQQMLDSNDFPVLACAQFADGFSWGPVKTVDVTLGGKVIGATPIQVIGDPAFPLIPSACANTGPQRNTVQSFGANGVLGVGAFVYDCGSLCTNTLTNRYFVCPPGAACSASTVTLNQQVINPVALMSGDNNGVVLTLPSVPPNGAATVSGSLIFGIGTQSNNALGNVRIFPLTANGTFTTLYNGQAFSKSFIDSGSNSLFIQDPNIPVCTDPLVQGFFCPATALDLNATFIAANGSNAVVDFSVANALALRQNSGSFAAFGNLAAPSSLPDSFDWGLPFFYGRTVFTALEARPTPGGNGPYIAY